MIDRFIILLADSIWYVLQIRVERRVEGGDPRDVICQTVERLNADILVMGSHGYGLIKRWDLPITSLQMTVLGQMSS